MKFLYFIRFAIMVTVATACSTSLRQPPSWEDDELDIPYLDSVSVENDLGDIEPEYVPEEKNSEGKESEIEFWKTFARGREAELDAREISGKGEVFKFWKANRRPSFLGFDRRVITGRGIQQDFDSGENTLRGRVSGLEVWENAAKGRESELEDGENAEGEREADFDSGENTLRGRVSGLEVWENAAKGRESELEDGENAEGEREADFDFGENTGKGTVFIFCKDDKKRLLELETEEMPWRREEFDFDSEEYTGWTDDEADFDLGENTAQDRDPEFWKNNERDTNTALDILGRNDNFLIGH